MVHANARIAAVLILFGLAVTAADAREGSSCGTAATALDEPTQSVTRGPTAATVPGSR